MSALFQFWAAHAQELLRLVQLGLVGRLRIQATLYRPRALWFDARLAETSRELAVSWSREEETFTVEGRPVSHPNRLELPELVLGVAVDADLQAVHAGSEVVTRVVVAVDPQSRGTGTEPCPVEPGASRVVVYQTSPAQLVRPDSQRCVTVLTLGGKATGIDQ